jgi:UDP-2,3-diacylglucosamine hydrolase
MITYFISDLHLSSERPDITGLFEQFLQQEARSADALYILGDLFDAWIGDDDQTEFHQRIIRALAGLTQAGVPTYFIHGNRDFVIGERFARETGVTLLPEEACVTLYGEPTLIMHGDTLCTLDTGYLRFRRIIRNPMLLGLLSRLPLSFRRYLASRLRAESKSQKKLSAAQLERMDATEEAVQEAFKRHSVRQLIHGHTHRPAVHYHQLPDGATATRVVLGDWFDHGSVLEVSPDGLQLRHKDPVPLSSGG